MTARSHSWAKRALAVGSRSGEIDTIYARWFDNPGVPAGSPLSSEFLTVFRNSSPPLTIGPLELTAQSQKIAEYTFQGLQSVHRRNGHRSGHRPRRHDPDAGSRTMFPHPGTCRQGRLGHLGFRFLGHLVATAGPEAGDAAQLLADLPFDHRWHRPWHPSVLRAPFGDRAAGLPCRDPREPAALCAADPGQADNLELRLRSCGSRNRLRSRIAFGVTSTSSSSSI